MVVKVELLVEIPQERTEGCSTSQIFRATHESVEEALQSNEVDVKSIVVSAG